MQNIKKRVTCAALALLLAGSTFVWHPGQTSAYTLPQSRISSAKGQGIFSLAQSWNNRFVKKSYPAKYKSKKEVLGYYTKDWATDNLSQNSLKNNARKITSTATFSFGLNYSGQITGEVPAQALNTSFNNQIETYALVHNLTSAGFEKNLVHSVLSNPELRTKVINNIYSILLKYGFDGVHIDFENIPPGDRQNFNSFLGQLSKKLRPEGLKITLAVPAKTWDNPSDGWNGAFDYKYIATVADRVTLMTYDEHWIGGTAGPVASLPWVEKVIKYAKDVIPADKLLLGIGNYGYDWINGQKGYKSLPSKSALALAGKYGADIKWDSASQTPYFYYWTGKQKHVVWFESYQSAAFKLDLVNKYGLRGIAIWRLGFESSGFWNMVSKKFN